ncbi:dynamin family protein [Acinetobacter sp.]|uniref:dynamin family protein n=1 Tax=Acinetobacter sp. TaxID=472 RepID=UPI00388FDE32
MDNTITFTNTQLVTDSMFYFCEKMGSAHGNIEDGVLTARVVGEYSAGKTRVIREILANKIPENFLPISSLEAQTRLQLEISYGQKDELYLIEKSEDCDEAKIINQLTKFPTRAEVIDYSPEDYRLRLLIDEHKFILVKGDGYTDDNQPKKLFLIDTPGWNSGEDTLAEKDAHQYFVGEHNLAIIYVCHANRLDGEINKAKLDNFLEALGEAIFLSGKAHLHIVITHCQKDSQERLSQRMQERVLQQWQALYFEPDKLDLKIKALDFAEMSEKDIQDFRDNFWRDLLDPIGTEKFEFTQSYADQISNWPEHWDIRNTISKQIENIRTMQKVLNLACIDGQFIQNMNMTRLMGLSQENIIERLTERWLKQIEFNNVETLKEMTLCHPLAEEHPLYEWWNKYWLANLSIIYENFNRYIDIVNQTIGAVTPKIDDLQLYLSKNISPEYLKIIGKFSNTSFDLVTQVVEQKMNLLSLERFTATLLKLSVLQSRYEDHYQNQMAKLG